MVLRDYGVALARVLLLAITESSVPCRNVGGSANPYYCLIADVRHRVVRAQRFD